MHSIPVRKMQFELPTPADFEPKWQAGDIVRSYFSTGLSLYVAYLEPFLVKSVRRVLDQITDPDLKECVDRFGRQEAQHYRQHERFNEAVLGYGYPGLEEHFNVLKQDFDSFLADRSDKWCVGFVEGFEALTTQLALDGLRDLGSGDERTDPRWAALFKWHLLEEVEHRNVAYDVYQHLYGDYLFRVKMCWVAQAHILRFITGCMRIMSPVDVQRHDGTYAVPTMGRAGVWMVSAPKMLKTVMPWYTPHDYVIPDHLEALSAQLSEAAESVQ